MVLIGSLNLNLFCFEMEFFEKVIKRDELAILTILSKSAGETHMYIQLHSYVI